MDTVDLARLQFAITTLFHFLFVPLTTGLGFLIAIMETFYVVRGKEIYKRMAKFWGRLFVVNFAVGVVTGIVLEFQFGMNWSNYSKFVGDVFGAPLAIEALMAFFLESTFLGLWLFGWDKLNKYVHALCMWLIAIGSTLSAFWILMANSWMQNPVGFALKNGRAEMTDFWAIVTNPRLAVQFPHVFWATLVAAAFFVTGVSAWHLLRNKGEPEFFRRSINIGIVVGLVAGIGVLAAGHAQAQFSIQNQPMKMAAAEALWNTEDPAGLSVFTIGDEKNRTDIFSIRLPSLLSFLAYDKLTGEVKGINDLQAEYVKKYGAGNYVPPVWISYWSFRGMVGSGVLMVVVSLYAVFLLIRKRLERRRWFLWALVGAAALPYLANTCGWILTEMGRQPWVVQGLLKTQDAVSPSVGTISVVISLLSFTLLYAALGAVDLFLMFKLAKSDPHKDGEKAVEDHQKGKEEPVLAY
jgi:cytochrome bd ubiquinol oxidase subunit I